MNCRAFRLRSAARLLCLFSLSWLLSFVAVAQGQAANPVQSHLAPGEGAVLSNTADRFPKVAVDEGMVRSNLPLSRLLLLLRPTTEQETALHQLLDAQQDRDSPYYHQWLTPAQFGQSYGLSNSDVRQVEEWLVANGFGVSSVSKSGRWVEFSGTAYQVSSAFHAEIHRISLHGQPHILNTENLTVPEALAPMVTGIVSLNDFFKHPQIAKTGTVARADGGPWELVQPETVNTKGQQFLSPADFATIYNIKALYQDHVDGTGQSIAIAGRTDISQSDVQAFREAFNLPLLYPKVIVNGMDPGFTSDNVEASLDVEWAGAVAPEAAIDYVESASTNTTDGIDLSAAYIVDNDLAPVLSLSYSGCESQMGTTENAFWNSLWEQAAAEGISVVVAAGDTGAAECDDGDVNEAAFQGLAVNGLASTPYDTAVGGTEFDEGANSATYWNASNGTNLQTAIGYIPEEAWNESCDPTQAGSQCPNNEYSLYAGGGGVSSVYSKPPWQTGAGVPADGQRDLPDVALAAAAGHDGYLLCAGGSCLFTGGSGSPTTLDQASVAGGTSAATPAFAGMMALIDQTMGARQGLANYLLYKIAADRNQTACNSSNLTDPSTSSACAIYDITAGNNDIPGQIGYQAAPGYDLASGLGSVNAANLANAWPSVTFTSSSTSLSAGTTTAAHGTPVQLSGAVTASVAGSGLSVATGTVTFVTDKYGPVGSAVLDSTGKYSVTLTNLPGGQYDLRAVYSGDATYGGSTSAPVAMNVSPEAGQVSLGAYNYINGPPEPIASAPYGDYVYLIATVTGASGSGSATGSVSFYDNGTLIGTGAISGKGSAVLVSAGPEPLCLGVGQHSLTASYSGDNSFAAGNTQQAFTFSVTRGDTAAPHFSQLQVSLSSTQELVLPVYVGGAGSVAPTGTVQFLDNGVPVNTPQGVVQTNSSTTPMAWIETLLAAGTHTITASYSGDDNYLPEVSSDQVSVQVSNATGVPVQVTLKPSGSSSTVDAYTSFAATISAGQTSPAITGTMQLYDSYGIPSGLPVQVSNGTATLQMQWSFAGDQVATVEYSGDSTYAAGGATSRSVDVARANPVIQLAVAPPNALGQVSMTATIGDPATPGPGQILIGASGKVQFYDSLNGGVPQAVSQPVGILQGIPQGNGFESFAATQVSVLSGGLHTITATYLGSPEYNPVTSAPTALQVGTPGIEVYGLPTALSVVSGQSGSVALTLSGQNGFTGSASLSCSGGIPAGAKCTIAPATVTLSSAPAAATLTLNTMAPSAQPSARLAMDWLIPAGASFALVFFLFPVTSRGRRRMLCLLCLLCVGLLQSCGGGGSSGASGSSSSTQAVSTSTVLTSSSIKTASGSSLSLTARVTSTGSPTGTVTFYDGSTSLGQAQLGTTGSATLPVSDLSVGTHQLSAKYAGDTADLASSSGILDQAITGTVQLTVLASSGSLQTTITIPVTVQ